VRRGEGNKTAPSFIFNVQSGLYALLLTRWTIQSAIEEAISAEVLTVALFARFRSRQEHTFAEKMLSAMRNNFGGHVEIYPGN
jgi:6-phosphogluconate dehydrogenase (decarboxylating)